MHFRPWGSIGNKIQLIWYLSKLTFIRSSSNYAKRNRVDASVCFIRSYGTRDIEFSNMNLVDFSLRTRPMVLQSGEWGLPGQDGSQHTKRVLRSTSVKSVLEAAFPANLGYDTTEIHFAAKLALYRNWHNISDILGCHDTFKDAFTSFMTTVPHNIVAAIDNLSFIHESSVAFNERIVWFVCNLSFSLRPLR